MMLPWTRYFISKLHSVIFIKRSKHLVKLFVVICQHQLLPVVLQMFYTALAKVDHNGILLWIIEYKSFFSWLLLSLCFYCFLILSVLISKKVRCEVYMLGRRHHSKHGRSCAEDFPSHGSHIGVIASQEEILVKLLLIFLLFFSW